MVAHSLCGGLQGSSLSAVAQAARHRWPKRRPVGALALVAQLMTALAGCTSADAIIGSLPQSADHAPLTSPAVRVESAVADSYLQMAFQPWTTPSRQPLPHLSWTGGDVGASTALTETRTLWVFGDTLLGQWNQQLHSRVNENREPFPHSSIGVMDLTKPPRDSMSWHWGANVTSFFRPSWEKNSQPGQQAFWAASTTSRAVGGRLLVVGNRVLYTAQGGPMGFIVNETVVFTVDNATDNPDDPSSWRLEHFALPHTGNLSHLPTMPIVDLGKGTLLVGGSGQDPYLYLYGYTMPAGGSTREVVSRIQWAALMRQDFSRQEYWVRGDRWQMGWTDDLPQTMATLWTPQVPEMQVQYCAALETYVLVTIPYLSTVVEMRTSPAPQGPWSAPAVVYRIPPPQNDTAKFFCYAAMQHDLDSLLRLNGSAPASGAVDIVFTYVCNGRTLGAVYAPDEWASYIPQFVRLRLSKGDRFATRAEERSLF